MTRLQLIFSASNSWKSDISATSHTLGLLYHGITLPETFNCLKFEIFSDELTYQDLSLSSSLWLKFLSKLEFLYIKWLAAFNIIDICLTYIGIFLSNRGPPCAQRNLAQRARETRLGDIVSVKSVLRNRSYV